MGVSEYSSKQPSYWSTLSSVLGPFLALAAVILFFVIADWLKPGADTFWTQQNFLTIAVSTATVAVAALGMTVVIIAGGIDLSAGTAIALCATVLAWGLKTDVGAVFHRGSLEQTSKQVAELESKVKRLTDDLKKLNVLGPERGEAGKRSSLEATLKTEQGTLDGAKAEVARCRAWTAPTAITLSVLTGCLCGCLNGVLVSTLRVVPFIVTLGTMMIYLGLAKHIGSETTVRPILGSIPDWLQNFTSLLERALWRGIPLGGWRGVPIGVWLTFVLAIGLAAILRYSVFGRYVFALGSNEQTARLCGINVPLTKIAVYSFAGFFIGMAGLYQFSRLSVGNPTSGSGLELRIIAAVVIGGASLSGGRGSVVGTLSGAAIMAVITSGCTLLELKNPIQDVILGVIIIAAVCVDQVRQHRIAR